jgi:mono/diheme cytochrome c family protein
VVYAGTTDVNGEIDLPKLAANTSFDVRCATSQSAPMNPCGTVFTGSTATVSSLQPTINPDRNLRLHGHVVDADGAVCGVEDEFFGVHSAATVQLQQADGTALGAAVRVNRFGDYALDAPVPANGSLKIAVACEGLQLTAAVPSPATAAGYSADQPVELSVTLANHRPVIARMVANGLDGNVRGAMVVPETGATSNTLPGALQFLSYKATDTRLSGCMYYRALGAVADCALQGTPSGAISFDDWKRAMHFSPYTQANTEVSATYINKMDLNLVRRMVATQVDSTHVAFYVCNHPGPLVPDQANVDAVLGVAFANQKQVACVAMEWTPSSGANGGASFTKFFVFAPDGSLLTSVNLDGRGEKYVPGSCVACHGGTVHNGRFPERGSPSPFLGSHFLPFDTGNYLFGSDSHLTETAQTESLYQLNQLVLATQPSSATSALIQGWYAGGTHVLDKTYVAPAWQAAAASQPGAPAFYREVVGSSCRTCHASLAPNYDWSAIVLNPGRASAHFCGGTADLALNASMPNALISRDRLMQRAQSDPNLQALMTTFLGCTSPLPDPIFPRR